MIVSEERLLITGLDTGMVRFLLPPHLAACPLASDLNSTLRVYLRFYFFFSAVFLLVLISKYTVLLFSYLLLSLPFMHISYPNSVALHVIYIFASGIVFLCITCSSLVLVLSLCVYVCLSLLVLVGFVGLHEHLYLLDKSREVEWIWTWIWKWEVMVLIGYAY